MKFIDVGYITTLQKGKLVRFKNNYLGENLSKGFKIKDFHKLKINIQPGNIGRVYEVRGGTLFIGFGKDLNFPPPKSDSATEFAACVTLHISDIDKIQFEE